MPLCCDACTVSVTRVQSHFECAWASWWIVTIVYSRWEHFLIPLQAIFNLFNAIVRCTLQHLFIYCPYDFTVYLAWGQAGILSFWSYRLLIPVLYFWFVSDLRTTSFIRRWCGQTRIWRFIGVRSRAQRLLGMAGPGTDRMHVPFL